MIAFSNDIVLDAPRKNGVKKPKTAEEYLRWNPQDGFKYEWQNGKLQKTNTMIQPDQQYIVDNLLDIFSQTDAYKQGARLSVEAKSKTIGSDYRVPDLAYFTLEQRREMTSGNAVVPQLVIEIISKTDGIYDALDKVKEYFTAGIALVWWVIPPLEVIYVFESHPRISIYQGEVTCQADVIATGFSFKTKDIFVKP
jgi:Uma2 family endonuclease